MMKINNIFRADCSLSWIVNCQLEHINNYYCYVSLIFIVS